MEHSPFPAEDLEQAWKTFQPTLESVLTGREPEEAEAIRTDVRDRLEVLLASKVAFAEALERIDGYVSRTYPRGTQKRFMTRRARAIRGGKAPRMGGPKD